MGNDDEQEVVLRGRRYRLLCAVLGRREEGGREEGREGG